MDPSINTHHSNLHKLCRICGDPLRAGGRNSYRTKNSQSILKTAFGVDVDHDDPHVHPESYCHRCRGVTYHAAKKGELFRHHREVFQLSEHSQGQCSICTHMTEVLKVGRKQKKNRKYIGRPQGQSSRALITHTLAIAPASLCPHPVQYAENSSLPLTELSCPICTDIVQRPVELTACSSVVCCECFVRWLHITEDTKCPCCYGGHLQDFSTVKKATPLFQKVLGGVQVICQQCTGVVKLDCYKEHAENCCSGKITTACTTCTSSEPSEKELSIGAILSKGSDAPLTPVERDLQTNLAKRSLLQDPQSLLRIKTGGQV